MGIKRYFLPPLIISLLILISCSGSNINRNYYKNVRYYFSTIRNINNKIITLADGTSWKSHRFIIAANLSDVIVVLEEYLDVGNIYINNSQYSVSLLSGSDSFRYSDGYLDLLQNVDTLKSTLELSNGTKWGVNNQDIEKILKWNTTPEIIISASKDVIIHPRNLEFARVVEIIQEDNLRSPSPK